MHDIEHTTARDDSEVQGTQAQPQAERTITPLREETATKGKPKRPSAWWYIIAGGTVLLVLAVIFAGLLSFGKQTVSKPSHPTPTPATRNSSTPAPSFIPTPSATPINSPVSSGHYLSMTIAGGVAYVGTVDNAVYALRISNGALLWHSRIEGAVSDRPQVGNGIVYVTSYVDQNLQAHVYALRANDGSMIWHLTRDGYSYLSLPTADSSVVYVASQADISALKSSDGSLLWRYSTNGDASAPPLVVNGVVYDSSYVNYGPGTLYALRVSNGTLLWKYVTDGFIGSPTAINGVVYIASNSGTLTALRASDGHQLWKQTLDATIVQPPQFVNGVLYTTATKILPPASTARNTGSLLGMMAAGALFWDTIQMATAGQTVPDKEGISSVYAIRANDGGILWHYTMANGGYSWASWFSVEHGVVYASAPAITNDNTSKGDFYALDSGNGSVLWHDVIHASPGSALLADGVIYLNASNASDAGAVYVLRAGDGSLLWNYPIAGATYDTPILTGTVVYVGAANGMVYALRAGNGKLLWHYQTDVGG